MTQALYGPACTQPSKIQFEVNKEPDEQIRAAEERYKRERAKRLRDDGTKLFVDLEAISRLEKFAQDPWVEENPTPPAEGDRCEILILGAGYGGLLYAVRLLENGIKPEDIRFADSANGFGGTWYWNRYPGLKCDIESYIYMPLLEETGYMPSQKYATGLELKEHADRIAKKYNLSDRAWFQRYVSDMTWNEDAKEWIVTYRSGPPGHAGQPKTMRSRFVVLTTGFTLIPRAPQVPGMEKFKGEIFHTARWDYNLTGGSPSDPNMTKLNDQTVGIIGTGATAIQVVSPLAKSSKKLLVFQRTPSAVDRRDNRPTDPEWWQREHGKPGWQKIRRENFTAFLSNSPNKPEVDLVSDGWTRMLSYSTAVGNPAAVDMLKNDPENQILAYVRYLHDLDYPRQESIRQRVEAEVKDRDVAEALKAWYPGWCKRPCFGDDYLESFNRDNVTLVDTDGQGVTAITENGVIANGKEYPLDLLILGTGYRSPFLYSPGKRVNIDITGRNGKSLDEKWMAGVTTLHGMMSHDFPNLCWPGLIQAGGTPNFTHCMDYSAQHMAEILGKALIETRNVPSNGSTYKYNFVIEPTEEAEEEWSQTIAANAGVFAANAGCTPSYINAEGEMDKETSPEVQAIRARSVLWPWGPAHFMEHLDQWRREKNCEGVVITTAE
ncbi:hypothetical protein CERZMDRAFT_113581 [Cercospora zeae-maydis SCOH1-5]|uniref:FAD/NAD(P)-binding domain-containing protein n=1 Tax=Cercospora zeae-maydis SCOH1-5 TaxID=717836 RepID=A0A6A6F8V0_9PEZI|nr:hypothetical protein CERZMDRAFT_113581 [Cercospora zeae-maydis SCOH1-5]